MMSASNDFLDAYNDDRDVFDSDDVLQNEEEADQFIEHRNASAVVRDSEPSQPGKGMSAQKARRCVSSLNCLLRAAETVASVLGLVSMTRINYLGYNFTYLQMLWRFRLFIFVSVVSFLSSFSLFILHSLHLSQKMPINWATLEACQCVFLTFGYLVSSALLSASQNYYGQHLIHWNSHEMIATLILGFLCSLAYTANGCLHCCCSSGQVTRIRSTLYQRSSRPQRGEQDFAKFEEVTSEPAIA